MLRRLVSLIALSLVIGVVSPAAAIGTTDLNVLVTDAGGTPLADAIIEIDARSATTDAAGRAFIEGVDPGEVTVSHSRFTPVSVNWTATKERLRVSLGADVLRALHVSGHIPGTPRWDELLRLADNTALNAVMLDMKDESGTVSPTWSGTAPAPAGSGRWDLASVAAELHARDLALIVRVVAFQDPRFAAVAPDAAVFDSRTGGPFTRSGQVFLDPSDSVARLYVRELTLAACAAGVDEVQLDYIRFPDGINDSLRFDHADPTSEASRSDTITSFIAGLQAEVGDCALAADVFGFVTSVETDGGIGQQFEAMAEVTDVLSPMVYPNHWSSGWFGYSSPAANPGGVVTASMANALERAGSKATMRPCLQDFGGYGAAEVRAQIDAADALGMGWMLWNARSEYQNAALPTNAEVHTPDAPPPPVEEDRPVSGYWDVADGSTFHLDVAWLGSQAITRGCNPPYRDEFCPDRGVTRAEAAAFLVRALDLPDSSRNWFDDDDGTTHEADINALADARITLGCGPTTFCPDRVLTREQMASLLARALDLPAVATNTFIDHTSSSHRSDIERIAAVGITRGCTATRFCPSDVVTREQMAAFLHRSLG